MRVLYDTFTESSDTALGSHTPDERPGSEAWTVASGGLDVIASTDRVQANQQAGNAAGINWAMVGDFDIYGDVYMSDTGNVSFPSLRAYLSTSYDTAEGVYFQYQEDNAQYVLGYESTNDGESFDTFASATPASGTTMRMERSGNTLNGYVGGVLRCTLSLTGTDFAGGATLYPGLTCATFSADRPAWDNFEVTQPGYIVVGTTDVTVATFALTVSTGGGTVTVGTTDVTVTTYPLTVSTGAGTITVGTADVVVTTNALAVVTSAGAGDFIIDGLDIPVVAFECGPEDIDNQARTPDGTMRSAERGNGVRPDVVRFTTDRLTEAQASALIASRLTQPGARALSGALMPTTFDAVLIEGPDVENGPLEEQVTVSAALRRQTP